MDREVDELEFTSSQIHNSQMVVFKGSKIRSYNYILYYIYYNIYNIIYNLKSLLHMDFAFVTLLLVTDQEAKKEVFETMKLKLYIINKVLRADIFVLGHIKRPKE